MRDQLCAALLTRAANPNMVFLTGDLGFMALEPLRDAMGDRFINAGVAEQNMITVAAALAAQRLEVWVYSIAPFCYARPFEQIRNDIAFHGLPVNLVGNGGGYGYGVMGPTHHAIEDYGVLLSLPNITAIVPAFESDVRAAVDWAGDSANPVYLRLGRGEAPASFEPPPFSPWRQVTHGKGPTVIAMGPIVGTFLAALERLPVHDRPNVWVACKLPIAHDAIPTALFKQIAMSSRLCVVEEHVRHGGLGSDLLLHLAELGKVPAEFIHLYARAHHFDRYGSQTYLRARSRLDETSLFEALGITRVLA